MWWVMGFYGYFSALLIGTWLSGPGVATFRVVPTVIGSETGDYFLWVGYFAIQTYAVAKSTAGKRGAADTTADMGKVVGRFS